MVFPLFSFFKDACPSSTFHGLSDRFDPAQWARKAKVENRDGSECPVRVMDGAKCAPVNGRIAHHQINIYFFLSQQPDSSLYTRVASVECALYTNVYADIFWFFL